MSEWESVAEFFKAVRNAQENGIIDERLQLKDEPTRPFTALELIMLEWLAMEIEDRNYGKEY